MNLQNVVQYVKKHKEVILIVAGTTILGVVGYSVYTDHKKLEVLGKANEITSDYALLDLGELRAAWVQDDGFTCVTFDDAKIEDFGKIGKEILKVNPGITTMGAMLGFKEQVV